MIFLRKNYPQLRNGSFEINYSSNGIFAFTRWFDDKGIVSIFNTNETSISIPWKKLEIEQRSLNFLIGNNNLLPKHGYGIYEVN